VTTIGDWLRDNADLDRIDREILLCEAAGVNRARLITAPETPLPESVSERLDRWSSRRRAGEPVAYLIGSRGFRDFELLVSPAVLIPRPETELLVETANDLCHGLASVLDLGTGSGAVAIAIARDTRAQVTAVDISTAALAVARANARRLNADVQFLHSDWFASVSGRFDLIVSNPPYVAAADPHLNDLRFEPELALVAGNDGLDSIRKIIADAPAHLKAGGWLVIEHGFDQGSSIRDLFRERGFTKVSTRRDLGDHERLSLGQWN
jgi:release factor glutamine methyltransferase